MWAMLLLPVGLLAGLLLLVVFGPMDWHPGVALVTAGLIVFLTRYTVAVARANPQ